MKKKERKGGSMLITKSGDKLVNNFVEPRFACGTTAVDVSPDYWRNG